MSKTTHVSTSDLSLYLKAQEAKRQVLAQDAFVGQHLMETYTFGQADTFNTVTGEIYRGETEVGTAPQRPARAHRKPKAE